MYAVPGTFILVREAQPSSGSDGTMIVHVGFHVPDVDVAFERWTAVGIDVERGGFPVQLWVHGPDGLLYRDFRKPGNRCPSPDATIFTGTSLILPLCKPGITICLAPFLACAVIFRQVIFLVLISLTVALICHLPILKAPYSIILALKSLTLRAAIAKLEAAGISMDMDYREIPEANLAIAFLTDPWGTYIELTQGLEP